MLFVISSLEAAWVDEVTDINELDELNAIGLDENGIGKHKHLCREECDHPAMGRCLKSECIQACKETGYITGKCKKSASYDVKKCYCYKDCVMSVGFLCRPALCCAAQGLGVVAVWRVFITQKLSSNNGRSLNA
ncbi:unnamed protein product [Rhodiola kirilowii]